MKAQYSIQKVQECDLRIGKQTQQCKINITIICLKKRISDTLEMHLNNLSLHFCR